MWECGLKLFGDGTGENLEGVTPYVGVWIETMRRGNRLRKYVVTPYVGVWIETRRLTVRPLLRPSLLMWECGLKQ